MRFIDFSDRKIMVIGASSGVGEKTSILLSQLGAKVVLASRNIEKLEMVKARLLNPDKHVAISYDVRDVESGKDFFDQAVVDGHNLSGLVYWAGIAKAIPLRVMSYTEYSDIFSVNYYGFVNVVNLFAKKKYNAGGSIVAVSAVNAHYPQKCMTLYASSKLAVEAAVRTLSLELADQGIRINSVIPGAVDTPMTKEVNALMLESIASKQLLGMQKPEQIADFIVYLLSDRANAITGRNLFSDGGMLGQ